MFDSAPSRGRKQAACRAPGARRCRKCRRRPWTSRGKRP